MNGYIQLIKWLFVPRSIVIAQIALNANGKFQSTAVIWRFIAPLLIALLLWRNRPGQLISGLTQSEIPNMENVGRSDRRFAL